MIEKLTPSHKTSYAETVEKINEVVNVVNALIDGEFPDSMDKIDFRLKLAENLRKAQSEVKK